MADSLSESVGSRYSGSGFDRSFSLTDTTSERRPSRPIGATIGPAVGESANRGSAVRLGSSPRSRCRYASDSDTIERSKVRK
ncbi:hypothetical protein BRD01_05875 [Halobacteriales archaeon QS_8_65_32]|nr:MAG: hypothetical protein BRD01_05875 [Halobacteriales archaeon QS_8_65_32]